MNNFLNLLFSIFNSLQKLYLGHFGGCSSSIPCPEDEGDCDKDSQCKEGLKCGINNCLVELQYEPFFDCCYKPCEGNDCCSADHLCGMNEGDCNFDHQCQFGLRCGYNNCPTNSSYLPTDNCCYKLTELMSPNYPNSYPNNANENWLITDPTASFITLQFHYFHVRIIVEFENTIAG